MRRGASMLAALLMLVSCGGDDPPGADGSITVSSSELEAGGTILQRYTCDGENISPPLEWSEFDAAAQYAIVMTDPDAPTGTFVHWVLLHVPKEVTSIEAGEVPDGAVGGQNSFGSATYGGPCPPAPDGPHRYRFTVYALSGELESGEGAPYEQVREELQQAALAEGTLEVTYDR